MSKADIESGVVLHTISAELLCCDSGYEIIRELLLSDDLAAVFIGKCAGIYRIEGKTMPEYQQIMRKYVSAFPGSLSMALEQKNDDLAKIKKWLGDGFTLLLIAREDFVRAYRYVAL